MRAAYLLALLLSLGGMVVCDRRWRLFFFADARRAALVLLAGVAYFLAWDAVGIAAGVFFRGDSPYQTGVLLAPELPLEEVVFLVLLSYLTMNLYGAAARRLRGGTP